MRRCSHPDGCNLYGVTDNRCCYDCEHKRYCKGFCGILEYSNANYKETVDLCQYNEGDE